MPKYHGHNLETAIQNGLKDLNLDKKDVKIKTINPGSNGFFGFFKKEAEVEIIVAKQRKTTSEKTEATPKAQPVQPEIDQAAQKKLAEDRFERNFAVVKELAKYLQEVLEEMGIDATLEVDMPNNKRVYIDCRTEKEGLLIGKHGRTINALQQLCEFFLTNHGVNYVEVILDTANYRERRQRVLASLAKRTAKDVENIGKPVHLDAMPAFERKQVHMAIEDDANVLTYSVGNEPNREVVIAPR
ncbi:RNA-binding cell elongation regulator Jag/EloR [Fructilactobacillus vespulae]|uniref:RNA-binding cell elongation regulator Jag/EloR n=1 Tax=Fructilactobacillus vespulae TaxID=1249630 RepID=UPI0039B42E8A